MRVLKTSLWGLHRASFTNLNIPIHILATHPILPSSSLYLNDPSPLTNPRLTHHTGLRPIRRLQLRQTRLRNLQQRPASNLHAILPQRRLCRPLQHAPLQPHRTHPHPPADPTPRPRKTLHRPHRLHPQTHRPPGSSPWPLPRHIRDLAPRGPSLRRLVRQLRIHDERRRRAQRHRPLRHPHVEDRGVRWACGRGVVVGELSVRCRQE